MIARTTKEMIISMIKIRLAEDQMDTADSIRLRTPKEEEVDDHIHTRLKAPRSQLIWTEMAADTEADSPIITSKLIKMKKMRQIMKKFKVRISRLRIAKSIREGSVTFRRSIAEKYI